VGFRVGLPKDVASSKSRDTVRDKLRKTRCLRKLPGAALHQRVVQLEYAVRIGSYVASKARYTRMTDSAQVVQTTDEKHSGKRVKPYVKPSTCNGPACRRSVGAVCLPVLKHGPRSLLLRAKRTVLETGYWGESTLCQMFPFDLQFA